MAHKEIVSDPQASMQYQQIPIASMEYQCYYPNRALPREIERVPPGAPLILSNNG
jgi:hypothetical protein